MPNAQRLTNPPAGLSAGEAAERLRRDGPNELPADRGRSASRIFLLQLRNPLVPILVVAAIVSRLLGEGIEATVILLIVMTNACFGFVQEYRAERAVQALRQLVARTARVVRDGVSIEVPAGELVCGDLVEVELGDLVPADLQLLESSDLAASEAVLTGESLPVAKATGDALAMGVEVVGGTGRGVVTATGARTVLGRTSALVARKPDETDFQRNMRRLSGFLVRIMTVLTVFVFVVNTVAGRHWFEAFLFAVALAVGMTPEVLPAIVTIALARGAQRMARNRVVVKQLMSVEDLGNMEILCCDKTGTLTLGEFSLSDAVDTVGHTSSDVMLLAAVAAASGRDGIDGPAPNATDRAIWASPLLPGVRPQLAGFRVLSRHPIDFARRRTAVLVSGPAGPTLVVKGAPEALLEQCTKASLNGRVESLTPEQRQGLLQLAARYEADGLRVLVLADRPAPGNDGGRDDAELTVHGLLLLRDPPKPGAREALERFARLGVAIKVLSGDSVVVTRRICRDVGLAIPEERIIDGHELEAMDDARFAECVASQNVFARVTPEQKFRLVNTLRRAGRVVGFLGDGVNDAPALRAADVGIAVDSGSDVAKQAADVVLLEKHLLVIADGIEEGRRTFANITKYLLNTLSANFGNMATLAASSIFLPFIPMLPSQILLNNLISDLPLVTLATDRVDEQMLQRPQQLDLRQIWRFMVVFGLVSAAFDALLIATLLRPGTSVPVFRTTWFVESALSEILVTFAIRTRQPFFRSTPGVALLITSVLTAAVAIALPYFAPAQRLFAFAPLGATLMPALAVLVGYFITAEVVKRWFFVRITS